LAGKAAGLLPSHPILLLSPFVSPRLAEFPDREPKPFDRQSDCVLASVDGDALSCSRQL
jgi:hypothetical protein